MRKGYTLLPLVLLFGLISACSTKAWRDRPIHWAEKNTQSSLRNFYQVDTMVYRSEKPDADAFRFFEKFPMGSVLDLRQQHKDKKVAGETSLMLFSVPMKSATLTDTQMIEALRIIHEAPKPIVVHCAYGSDRTGVTMAMYRIVFQNWTKEEAINEMKHGGFHFHLFHENLVDFIQNADIELYRKSILKK